MDPYIQLLQRDYDAGVLLMECIAPLAYDTLVNTGIIEQQEYERFLPAASTYLQAWSAKHGRTVHNLLDCPGIGLEEKSRQMQWLKEQTAKRMAVYDHLSKTKELSNGKV